MSVFKTILPAPSGGLLPPQLCIVNAAQSSFFPIPQPAIAKSENDQSAFLSERQRAAHKILHYGSRHVIQNNGWTTRLTKELPHLRPIQGKATTFKNASDSNQQSTDSTKVPMIPTAPKQNVVQPDSVSNGLAIRYVGPNRDATHVLPTLPSTSGGNTLARPVCVLSDQYPLQRPAFVCPAPPAVNAILTVPPTTLNTPSRTPNICLVPLSAPGQVAVVTPVRSVGGGLTTPSTPTFPGIKQGVVLPTPLPGLPNMSQPALYSNVTSYATSGRILNSDNAKPLTSVERGSRCSSSSMTRSVKTLSVYPTNDTTGVPEIRVLNTQVRIDNGLITEVNELTTESGSSARVSAALAGLSKCDILTDSLPHQHPVYLTDGNGAQFGYIESDDGQRVRIAHDTSGQRYSPFLLLQPKTGSFACNDVSVDVCTYSKRKDVPVPTEAEVSAVGTVFTYEPLFVSEQTLVPVSGSNFEPKSIAPANKNAEDDSDFAYRCYMCQFWSLDQTKLARHWLNVHMPELQYCCPYCDRRFFTNVRAQLHVQHQHSKSGLPTVAFRHSEHFVHSLQFEIAQVDENDCSYDADGDGDSCDQIKLENTDDNEQQRKLNNMPFTCRKCNFQTRSLHELRQHGQSIHVRFRPFVCDYCESSAGSGCMQPSFATKANLMQHIKAKHPRQFKNICVASRFDVSASESQKNVRLRAKIPWSESWEEIYVAGERVLQCRRCTFQAATARNIWPHVLRQHKWPANIYCPQCLTSVSITDNDRITGVLSCSACSLSVALGPVDSDSMTSDVGEIVYVCNICSFKTRERSSMIRHLKYNHTKCRPYACPYCSFVAVEWPKVHMHAASNHPDLPAVVKDQADATDQFRHVVDFLFSKLVSVMLVDSSSLDLTSAEVRSDGPRDGRVNQTDASLQLVTVKTEQEDLPTFCCSSCSLETSDLQELKGHQCAVSNVELACENSTADASVNRVHFKCRVCGYFSTDRSSMARHVKYMHIRARPHSCPYCAYNNVEKAKVKLHVKAHHPMKQRYVHTDHKLLEQLSWHAKQFYIRVNCKGSEVQENVCPPVVGSTTDVGEQFYTNKSSSADSSSSNCSPSSPPLDARLSTSAITDGLAAMSSSNGDRREDWELHDDVEFEIKPDWMTQRNPEMFGRDAFLAVDHNYYSVGKLPPNDRFAEPRLLAVKPEPIDIGYENVYVFSASIDGFSSGGLVSSEQSNANCETLVDIKPDVASQSWSDSDDDDAFFSSDLSDDACSLPGNDDCKPQLDLLGDPKDATVDDVDPLKPPPVQKRKLDCEFAASNDFDAVKIDPKVLDDPKIKKMRAVVELQDVVQLIYALQSGGLDLLG